MTLRLAAWAPQSAQCSPAGSLRRAALRPRLSFRVVSSGASRSGPGSTHPPRALLLPKPSSGAQRSRGARGHSGVSSPGPVCGFAVTSPLSWVPAPRGQLHPSRCHPCVPKQTLPISGSRTAPGGSENLGSMPSGTPGSQGSRESAQRDARGQTARLRPVPEMPPSGCGQEAAGGGSGKAPEEAVGPDRMNIQAAPSGGAHLPSEAAPAAGQEAPRPGPARCSGLAAAAHLGPAASRGTGLPTRLLLPSLQLCGLQGQPRRVDTCTHTAPAQSHTPQLARAARRCQTPTRPCPRAHPHV